MHFRMQCEAIHNDVHVCMTLQVYSHVTKENR